MERRVTGIAAVCPFRLVRAGALALAGPVCAPTVAAALHNQTSDPPAASQRPQDLSPPWEGSGTYYFNGLLLDLNHRVERWVPGYHSTLTDCSTEDLFCLRAEGRAGRGVVAFVGPRWCEDLQVGNGWRVGEMHTVVLARIEREQGPIRNALDLHRRRAPVVYYLGDESNPKVVYEYIGGSGVVAIIHGLTSYPDLVGDIRRGLNPESLPRQHRMALLTLDRFANCRRRPALSDPEGGNG